MIRINLASKVSRTLTGGAGKSTSSSDSMVFNNAAGATEGTPRQAVSKILFAVIFPIILYVYQTQIVNPELNLKISQETQALEALNKVISGSKDALNEKKKLEDEKKKIQAQKDTIEALKKARLLEVKILDLIQKGIPEKVWLTDIEFREGKLSLTGLATNAAEATSFSKIFDSSAYVSEVSMPSTAEIASERGTLQSFKMIMSIQNPGSVIKGGQIVK